MGEIHSNNGLKPIPDAIVNNGNHGTDTPPTDVGGDAQSLQPLSPETLRCVADEVRKSFVRPLGKSELVLLEVDPYRLHAFWTVTREAMELARDQLGTDGKQASMILRVMETNTDETGSFGGATFDVEVGGLQSRSYIDIFGDARRYQAILGLRAADNRFVTMVTSNPVELPRPSSATTNAFCQIDIDAAERGTFSSPSAPLGSETSNGASFSWFGHDDAETVPARFPLPPGTPLGRGVLSAEGPRQSAEEPAAEASAAQHDEAPAERPPLVLEQALTSSSYGLGRANGFEVIAELHVHGHAEPERDLHLFGRKIPLRPDGSFSIRHILPNDPSVIEALLSGGDPSTDRGDH